jgi:hypothetical protein
MDCPDVPKAQLSFATQRVRKPSLTVEGPNEISNVPEGKKEFKLTREQ